jgi:hypothetical protein
MPDQSRPRLAVFWPYHDPAVTSMNAAGIRADVRTLCPAH